MNNVLIKASFKVLGPILAVISFYLLLRGHNLPGGGFIGGLCLSLALILRILMEKDGLLEQCLKDNFIMTMGIFILCFIFILLFPLFYGGTLLTGLWSSIPLPLAGKFSSILIFDLVIYFVVALCTTKAYVEFTNFTGEGRL